MIVVLGAYSQVITDETSDTVFSESGPFEQASPWLWLALGVLVFAVARKLDRVVIASNIVCAACAAREWDTHKVFTDYSVLKPGFYLTTEHPLHHQLFAGVALLLLGISCLVIIHHAWRVWPRGGQPIAPWIWSLIVAALMLVGTKVLDRTPAVLREDMAITLSNPLLRLFTAWEEGLEATIPVAFAAMVLAFHFRSPVERSTNPSTETGIDAAS